MENLIFKKINDSHIGLDATCVYYKNGDVSGLCLGTISKSKKEDAYLCNTHNIFDDNNEEWEVRSYVTHLL